MRFGTGPDASISLLDSTNIGGFGGPDLKAFQPRMLAENGSGSAIAQSFSEMEMQAELRGDSPEEISALRDAFIQGQIEAAKEYASRACEVAPETAAYRKTLGQVYAAAGLYKNAQREFEQAVKLDPRDEEAKLELKTTKRMVRRTPLGGS